MLDLETFSTKSNAAIITIGAIKFNRYSPTINLENIDEKNIFYRRIIHDSNREIGAHFDDNTIKWWNTQNEESKHEIFTDEGRTSISNTLFDFSKWFGHSRQTKIWGHGSVFDCTILENAYVACGIEVPWKFWNIRDTRTLFDISNLDYINTDNNIHHAIHDCNRQINGIKEAIKKLKNITN